jgi:CheY-like chemotaxis protein
VIDRDDEVDIACALGKLPAVAAIYKLDAADPGAHPDAFVLGVALRPYTGAFVAEAHYALLRAFDHATTGRVLYMNADMAVPPFAAKGRILEPTATERAAAGPRLAARAQDAARLQRLEAASGLEGDLQHARARLDEPVAVSLESGVFEIVPDPFPSPKVRGPRILVIEDDLETKTRLKQLEGVEIVHITNGWEAIDALTTTDFDLALCALRLGEDFTGARLFRLVSKERPAMAARIVFLAAPHAIAGAPPSSAMGRVLPRPVDVEAVRNLLDTWRKG